MSSQVLTITPHGVGFILSVTREFQVSNLVGNKRESCVLPKSTLYHSRHGCLPIDSFLHWTLSTVNLEMKHRGRHDCSNDQTTQRKRACNRRNTERRKNGIHCERCSIVIHIRIDPNREYRISIHLRMDSNREYCVSTHHRICSRSTRYFQSMSHQRSSQHVEDRILSEGNVIQQTCHRESVTHQNLFCLLTVLPP